MDKPKKSIGLGDLGGVSFTDPIPNGDVVKYNSATLQWENQPDAGGGGSLAGLSDVNIGTLYGDEILKYDSGSGKWINSNTLANVQLTADNVKFADLADATKKANFRLDNLAPGTSAFMRLPSDQGSGDFNIVGTTNAQNLENKGLRDNTTTFYNAFGPTKKFHFDCGSIQPGNDQNLIVPDAPAGGQITLDDNITVLTNKDMTDASNNLTARALWYGSGTASISSYAAPSPAADQVLTAVSATDAVWKYPAKRRNFIFTIKDAGGANELNFLPQSPDLSPADFGNLWLRSDSYLVEFSATLAHTSSQTITAGTMTFSIGTVAAPNIVANYTNVADFGALTSASGTDPVMNPGLLNIFIGAGSRVVFRQTTTNDFAVSNPNIDVVIEAVFESYF